MSFVLTKAHVFNRGVPPDSFLSELVAWAKTAPDEIFLPNDRTDIYTVIRPALGPWTGLAHRKAAMLEALRVLAGFESSWNWNEGVDTNNPTSNTPCTEEAGIFQVSGNAMSFDASLPALLQRVAGRSHCRTFITATKSNHAFAIEFAARLLRFTINHNGPVKRKEICPWVSRASVDEFERLIA